jgi:hypothetical protein
MRCFSFLPAIVLLFLISCNTRKENTVTYQLRDSIIKKDFKFIDSSGEYDTTDINYKALKAYINNDTAFFKMLDAKITEATQEKAIEKFIDTCLNQPRLQDLNADEAYRFVYGAAFCNEEYNITVSKKGDSVNLHFVIYELHWICALAI